MRSARSHLSCEHTAQVAGVLPESFAMSRNKKGQSREEGGLESGRRRARVRKDRRQESGNMERNVM